MNVRALKYELIEWLTKTNDSSLLQTLKSIKDSNAAQSDWLDDLSQSEKQSLHNGIEDHKKGNVMGSAEFWQGYEGKI